jgi:phosphopantetheinyl transferase (holo-ACP synthase)
MISVGNDVVALNSVNLATTVQPNFYNKILSALELSLYRTFFSDLTFSTYVWLLWSIKESVYKCAKRLEPQLIFSPARTIVQSLIPPVSSYIINLEGDKLEQLDFDERLFYKGQIHIGNKVYCSRSFINNDIIHTVVNNQSDFSQTSWGVKKVAESWTELQSTSVREFALARLGQVLNNQNLSIVKSDVGYPLLLQTQYADLPLTFSHHDVWVAYAFISQ